MYMHLKLILKVTKQNPWSTYIHVQNFVKAVLNLLGINVALGKQFYCYRLSVSLFFILIAQLM